MAAKHFRWSDRWHMGRQTLWQPPLGPWADFLIRGQPSSWLLPVIQVPWVFKVSVLFYQRRTSELEAMNCGGSFWRARVICVERQAPWPQARRCLPCELQGGICLPTVLEGVLPGGTGCRCGWEWRIRMYLLASGNQTEPQKKLRSGPKKVKGMIFPFC